MKKGGRYMSEFQKHFKPINCDPDLMMMVTGRYDAEAYAFNGFDEYEDVVTEYFGEHFFVDMWYPLDKLTTGKAYLLLVGENDVWTVDIRYAERMIDNGIQDTISEMLKALR